MGKHHIHGASGSDCGALVDVAIGYPFLGGGGSRDIQLALKFTF